MTYLVYKKKECLKQDFHKIIWSRQPFQKRGASKIHKSRKNLINQLYMRNLISLLTVTLFLLFAVNTVFAQNKKLEKTFVVKNLKIYLI